MGVLCFVLVLLFSTLCHSTFAIIVMGERERESWLLYFNCLSDVFVAVGVLWLFLEVPHVVLLFVVVVFPDHTHSLF